MLDEIDKSDSDHRRIYNDTIHSTPRSKIDEEPSTCSNWDYYGWSIYGTLCDYPRNPLYAELCARPEFDSRKLHISKEWHLSYSKSELSFIAYWAPDTFKREGIVRVKPTFSFTQFAWQFDTDVTYTSSEERFLEWYASSDLISSFHPFSEMWRKVFSRHHINPRWPLFVYDGPCPPCWRLLRSLFDYGEPDDPRWKHFVHDLWVTRPPCNKQIRTRKKLRRYRSRRYLVLLQQKYHENLVRQQAEENARIRRTEPAQENLLKVETELVTALNGLSQPRSQVQYLKQCVEEAKFNVLLANDPCPESVTEYDWQKAKAQLIVARSHQSTEIHVQKQKEFTDNNRDPEPIHLKRLEKAVRDAKTKHARLKEQLEKELAETRARKVGSDLSSHADLPTVSKLLHRFPHSYRDHVQPPSPADRKVRIVPKDGPPVTRQAHVEKCVAKASRQKLNHKKTHTWYRRICDLMWLVYSRGLIVCVLVFVYLVGGFLCSLSQTFTSPESQVALVCFSVSTVGVVASYFSDQAQTQVESGPKDGQDSVHSSGQSGSDSSQGLDGAVGLGTSSNAESDRFTDDRASRDDSSDGNSTPPSDDEDETPFVLPLRSGLYVGVFHRVPTADNGWTCILYCHSPDQEQLLLRGCVSPDATQMYQLMRQWIEQYGQPSRIYVEEISVTEPLRAAIVAATHSHISMGPPIWDIFDGTSMHDVLVTAISRSNSYNGNWYQRLPLIQQGCRFWCMLRVWTHFDYHSDLNQSSTESEVQSFEVAPGSHSQKEARHDHGIARKTSGEANLESDRKVGSHMDVSSQQDSRSERHSHHEVDSGHDTEQETSDESQEAASARVDGGVDLFYVIYYADLHVMVTQDGRPVRVYLPCLTREEAIRRMVEIDSLLMGGGTAIFRSDAFPILEFSSEGPGSLSNPNDGVGSGVDCVSNGCSEPRNWVSRLRNLDRHGVDASYGALSILPRALVWQRSYTRTTPRIRLILCWFTMDETLRSISIPKGWVPCMRECSLGTTIMRSAHHVLVMRRLFDLWNLKLSVIFRVSG